MRSLPDTSAANPEQWRFSVSSLSDNSELEKLEGNVLLDTSHYVDNFGLFFTTKILTY